MGDAGLGIITVAFYDRSHDSAANRAFVAAFKDSYGRNPDPLAVGGFDGSISFTRH
jgi:branched-chain amino acid transport system substrate-binding protein